MGQPQLARLKTHGDPLAGRSLVSIGTSVYAPTIELYRRLDVALAEAVQKEPKAVDGEEDGGQPSSEARR